MLATEERIAVFPAGAGMIRNRRIAAVLLNGVPRRRGDDPEGA